MKKIRRIGILNGGGDCPGLNAVTRALVRSACIHHGWEVLGIFESFDGLIWPDKTKPLGPYQVRGILPIGGTILGTTNRGDPFAYKTGSGANPQVNDFSQRVIDNFKKHKLDALVVVGGDGTLSIALKFHKLGLPVIGVPKTIDNDLSATDKTFGFDTALHTATDAIDKIHTTAASHGRVMFIEVMGRDAGWIALEAGMAGGADVILIPEIPFSLRKISEKMARRESSGSKFSLVVVAEGSKVRPNDPVVKRFATKDLLKNHSIGNVVGQLVGRSTGREVRVTVLGHIQRGGSPSPLDRILSTRFGVAAAGLVAQREFGRMVCLKGSTISSVSLQRAVGRLKTVPPKSEIVQAARAIGISFGDR